VALQVVVELEGDAGGLVERALDEDHVIDLWLKGLEDHVELPTATSALVDDEFSVRLEGTQRLKAHLEYQRVIRAEKAITSLLKEYRALDEALVLRVLDIELIAERISMAEIMESWKNNPQSLIMRLSCPRLEVVVNSSRCTFCNTAQWILPHELFAHAHDDGGLALRHRLRREGVWYLQDAQWPNAELVSLQQKREDLGVIGFHVDMHSCWLLEWVLESKHGRCVATNSS